MASKCLVEFREKKIVVNFDESLTRQELLANLQASGVLPNVDSAQLKFTVYDEDFKVFVDVSDDFVITDKLKVQLKEVSEYRVADVLDVEVAQMPLQVAPTFMSYTLPPVPLDIQMAIEKHRAGMHFEKRQRLIQWLFHDLCSYGMQPGKLYEEAGKALVAKYPSLADSTGTGYDSWRESLRFKAKYERRKIKIQRGEIVPTKRPQTSSTLTSGETTVKRTKRPTAGIEVWDGEDENSIRSHIAAMKKELAKPKADVSYVADCMLRTFRIRRDWIEKECPSIQAITDEYPSLKLRTMLHNEFTLQTGVDLSTTLRPLLRAVAKKVIEIAQKKRHLEAFLADFDSRWEAATDEKRNDLMETAAICLLPCLVKERKEAFLTTDSSTVHSVPTVVCTIDAWDSTPFRVCLEDIEIQEITLPEALSTLFALYWAFDIVFAKGVHKTLEVIAKLLNVPSNAHLSPLARVAYTVLKACIS
ncbi:hypothetical protein HPB49_014033 [Dermacentor silvarum]|uniref:Uncharacterized protein n=2 Tax=Dermacentor silvarum TaxID=543639 RepID=A0ACB8C408_DERSI|nr:hypothetical protein HPB49_014033 [Dermacentor silvarum]